MNFAFHSIHFISNFEYIEPTLFHCWHFIQNTAHIFALKNAIIPLPSDLYESHFFKRNNNPKPAASQTCILTPHENNDNANYSQIVIAKMNMKMHKRTRNERWQKKKEETTNEIKLNRWIACIHWVRWPKFNRIGLKMMMKRDKIHNQWTTQHWTPWTEQNMWTKK